MIFFPPQFLLKFTRLPRQKVRLLPFLLVGALAISGCPGSDEQASEETQEQLPTAQESPDTNKVAPPLEEEDVAVTEPAPSSTREDAQAELTRAQKAMEKAELLFQRAPAGKESELALSNLQQELGSAKALLQTGQEQFQDEQFQKARTQAREATETAEAVAQHIEQALNTMTRQSP